MGLMVDSSGFCGVVDSFMLRSSNKSKASSLSKFALAFFMAMSVIQFYFLGKYILNHARDEFLTVSVVLLVVKTSCF